MKSICLNMIVKNESAIIKRCLLSVKGLIDYWVICDTGSTDDTKRIIEDVLKDVSGELHDTNWVNFGHNRTEAIRLTKGKADYILVLDADMIATVKGDFKNNLKADSYLIKYEGDLEYHQTMLVSDAHDWQFVGVTHEYIHSRSAVTQEKLSELSLVHHCDGAMRADKFSRDIELLKKGLETEPNNARYMFYLAQSYKDIGQYDAAIEWYEKRVQAGGWVEEVWYCLYQIGRMQLLLGSAWATVLESFLKAYEFRPKRLEPIYEIAHHYRNSREYSLGHLFSKIMLETPYPDDVLFVEKSVYDYKLPLEYAICCYWVGNHREAIRVYNDMLDCPELPSEFFDAVIRNRRFSLDAIYPKAPVSSARRNKLKVVAPFYNPGHFLDNCIESLLSQDYDNFEIIFIDDASTDGSFKKVPTEDERVTLIRNETRVGGARNFHRAFLEYCQPDDIVIHVDGDDWLYCNDALSYINQFYNEHDCWVMYGQFRYSTGYFGVSKPYPDEESFSNLRQVWYSSHIRTFRAGLYHKISQQDPNYLCMKDDTGKWFASAMDMAVMYPIMEMAGFDKVRYNDRVLYVYNSDNPLAVHKTRREEELQNNLEIMRKKPFEKIPDYL